jgi:hypothetical protein
VPEILKTQPIGENYASVYPDYIAYFLCPVALLLHGRLTPLPSFQADFRGGGNEDFPPVFALRAGA